MATVKYASNEAKNVWDQAVNLMAKAKVSILKETSTSSSKVGDMQAFNSHKSRRQKVSHAAELH